MTNILVVDDEEQIRRLVNRTLSGTEYTCTLAADAAEARKCLNEQTFELVLCDVRMPGESGIDLTHPNELTINIRNALRRRKLEIANRMYRQDLEKTVTERTSQLKKALDGIIQVVIRIVESKDPYTAGHQHRVALLSVAIAEEMGIPKDQIEGIRVAGEIHDLGKISVPAEILSKPTRLTDIEFVLIKTHPRVGYDILKDINFPWPIAQMVLQHHEKMNGSGYPQGLSGEDILFESRILCVADVVEAMASHRPYRPALGIEKALKEIQQNKGTLYDPEVADACLKIFNEKGFEFE